MHKLHSRHGNDPEFPNIAVGEALCIVRAFPMYQSSVLIASAAASFATSTTSPRTTLSYQCLVYGPVCSVFDCSCGDREEALGYSGSAPYVFETIPLVFDRGTPVRLVKMRSHGSKVSTNLSHPRQPEKPFTSPGTALGLFKAFIVSYFAL